jgi:hypothetical protein
MPLAFWLMGARSSTTIDLNPDLKLDLVVESVEYLIENRAEYEEFFGEYLVKMRFDKPASLLRGGPFSEQEFLRCCDIEYIAPGDASETQLA